MDNAEVYLTRYWQEMFLSHQMFMSACHGPTWQSSTCAKDRVRMHLMIPACTMTHDSTLLLSSWCPSHTSFIIWQCSAHLSTHISKNTSSGKPSLSPAASLNRLLYSTVQSPKNACHSVMWKTLSKLFHGAAAVLGCSLNMSTIFLHEAGVQQCSLHSETSEDTGLHKGFSKGLQ